MLIMAVASPALHTDGVTNGDPTKEEVNGVTGQASDTASVEKLDVEAAVVEKPEYGPPEDMTLLKVRAACCASTELSQPELYWLLCALALPCNSSSSPSCASVSWLSADRCVEGRIRLSAGPEGCRRTQSLLSVLTRATAPGAAQVQQIAMMKQELVIDEKWTSVSEFNKVRVQARRQVSQFVAGAQNAPATQRTGNMAPETRS
jgi:hypothetical protein